MNDTHCFENYFFTILGPFITQRNSGKDFTELLITFDQFEPV